MDTVRDPYPTVLKGMDGERQGLDIGPSVAVLARNYVQTRIVSRAAAETPGAP